MKPLVIVSNSQNTSENQRKPPMWGFSTLKRAYILMQVLLLLPYLVFSQANQAKEDLMYSYFEKGYEKIYLQKDSTYFYLEKSLKIAAELGDYESSLGILDNIALTADYHQDLSKLQKTLKQVKHLLSKENISQKLTDFNSWNINYLMWLASYHYETKEYSKAKDLFVKARNNLEKIPVEQLTTIEAEKLYTLYSSLGTTYMCLANYELAELNFLRSIKLVNTSKVFTENVDSYITSSNQSMAQLYTRMGKYQQANVYNIKNLNWSRTYYEKNKKFKNNLINAYQQTTLSYIEQDSLRKALFFLDESQSFLLPNDPFYKDALLLYGDIHSGLNEHRKALINYKEALANFIELRENKPHQDIAKIYGKIAKLQLRQKNYQEGLKNLQKALNAAGNNIRITHFMENPEPSEVFSKTQLLELLDIKLQLLQGSYEENKDAISQDIILKISWEILKTFDLLKGEFESKLDKQFLAKKAYPIFHRLMKTAYKAYEKDNSMATIELALNIAEKNKDFLLLEALRNTQATQFAKVPTEILEKEVQLRTEITNVEKQLFDTAESDDRFSDALFDLKREYYTFLDTLKSNYPAYHKLKYQNRNLDMEEVRKKIIGDNGTLISYTMTEDILYAIIIDGSKQDFLKLSFTETDRETIRKFYRLLSSPSIDRARKELSEVANLLFKKVLKQPLANFDSKNLTIIPDGELYYLPFGLLKENRVYLLETKSIGYGNSVSSLLELKEKPYSKTNKLLAFAPSFLGVVTESPNRQFGKLLYNEDEAQNLERFFESETLLKGEATLLNFKANASQFNIVHLATHASANDEYPDYSYLAFTEMKDSSQNNILFIKDLYNMSLNADMVTLSACQTGIGKLRKGQGMLSLSKGFYYAGAKSLVNTLWKINDKSTVKLMEFFYEGLSKGKSKSEALREAKLKYLESTDDELLKHPYYWAAFVVSGDVSPITKNNTLWWILALGAFVTMVVLLARFFSKKGKRIRQD